MVDVIKGHYHHGLTIKEAREKGGMTQAKLAELWPKSSKFGGGAGVNVTYVQDIERGVKQVENMRTLRKLCEILSIPAWKFGLSEYDPFNAHHLPGHGERMFQETLTVVESLIDGTLSMRSTAPLPEVERNAQRINTIFDYFFSSLPPPSLLEAHFLSLHAQEQSLLGLMHYEHKRYQEALKMFEKMYETATAANNPALIVHSLQKMGVELNRADRQQDAINALEKARDVSFRSSKHVAAFANAYLAHIYADSGEATRFERSIETAILLAEPLKESYGDGTDYVYQRMSGILSIRARGYVRIKKPEKLFAMQEEVKSQIGIDHNLWMNYRLALYRARAYLMQHEIEESINAARESFRDVKDWHSPHRTTQAYEYLIEVEKAGYREVQAVKDFRDELAQNRGHTHFR